MEIVLQLALIIVPAGAVMLTAIYFMRNATQNEVRSMQIQLKKERQEFFLPNRVDAYQRAILLMERIHPNSLVMRLNNPGLPAAAFQVKLLESIREEYEHNIAQQMFISLEAWNMVKKSKEETVKIINLAGRQMDATSMALDLAGKIFEICAEIGTLPTEITVDQLKKEVQSLF